MVIAEPMRPEDESSKWSWISGVWDWYRVSGESKAKSTSIGIKRRRGEAMPHVKRSSVKAEVRWVAGEGWGVVIAEWTKSVTMALMVEGWDWLKPVFCWKLDSFGSGSDSIISSIEDNEAWSDRALASLTLSRVTGRLSECACSLWWLSLLGAPYQLEPS